MPEFGVAVRSQMLVGPTSYCMRTNPAYAHAFVRMEEFDWDEKVGQIAITSRGYTMIEASNKYVAWSAGSRDGCGWRGLTGTRRWGGKGGGRIAGTQGGH